MVTARMNGAYVKRGAGFPLWWQASFLFSVVAPDISLTRTFIPFSFLFYLLHNHFSTCTCICVYLCVRVCLVFSYCYATPRTYLLSFPTSFRQEPNRSLFKTYHIVVICCTGKSDWHHYYYQWLSSTRYMFVDL